MPKLTVWFKYNISVMSERPKKRTSLTLDESQPVTRRKAMPHQFVLDALAEVAPTTRAMFGALAVYVGERIVFLLRERTDDRQANGVWMATADGDDERLRSEFPNMRPVHIMGKDISGWKLLASDMQDFEESALRACELVVKRDIRIGKVPKSKRSPNSRR